MSAELPAGLRKTAERQAGVIARKQAIKAMPARAVEWKVRAGEWRRVHCAVYASFTGELPRRAQLWAAVLYAGSGAVLSHASAGELHGLVDKPSEVIHVTVPRTRRVAPVPGIRLYYSDLPGRVGRYEAQGIPVTGVADTVIDLAEGCRDVADVYGWVTRAFGRSSVPVTLVELLVAVKVRKRLRWRNELNEAIVAASGGAHSVLELLWDKDVERAHGLPESCKQVPFAKPSGAAGFRDREYVPFGLVIELDGKLAHPGEQRGQDRARDRGGAVQGKLTLRYGWREARYEACASAAEVARVLWRRGWRGRPVACSAGCPVAGALAELDARLAAIPGWQQAWAQQRAEHAPAAEAAAQRRAASQEALDAVVARAAQARILPVPATEAEVGTPRPAHANSRGA